MVGRRRTDQVYDTLQQLQRKITEDRGDSYKTVSSSAAAPSAPAPSRVTPPESPNAQRVAAEALVPAAGNVVLSRSWLLTVLVVWCAALFGMYLLGRASISTEVRPGMGADTFGSAAGCLGLAPTRPAQANQPGQSGTNGAEGGGFGAGFEDGLDLGPGPGSAGGQVQLQPALGDYYWVLSSVGENTPEALGELEAQAAEYNRWAVDNAAAGLQAYFAVRQPRSGGLQLVYGQKPGHALGVAQPGAGNASSLIEQALRQDPRYREIPGFRKVP
jgi:hypothetical protein